MSSAEESMQNFYNFIRTVPEIRTALEQSCIEKEFFDLYLGVIQSIRKEKNIGLGEKIKMITKLNRWVESLEEKTKYDVSEHYH